ncbi:MAG: twin-arginine translocase subunit TatC [Candidatus Xiphinematobacter sp.]|nr:MAG: twin-arginine translocase subunit TatC [Candidatus Xiphinematobacter sp.]QQY10839.1 MAG: twin-arginine translocase subunit TatC [Candidatus Xiphinematobacter sp.]
MSFWHKLFGYLQNRDEPKPFLDHIEDLRRMLIKMVVTLTTMILACFAFRTDLARLLQLPLTATDPYQATHLQSLGVADSMVVSCQISFYTGLTLSLPFLIFFLGEFILPALTKRERQLLLPAGVFCALLFLSGVALAYFVLLPAALAFFFLDARSMQWRPTWTVREYYTFTTQFIIAFGLAFELPLGTFLAVRLGLLDVTSLRRKRAFALVVILLLAAIITPTSDLFTLFLVATPMYGLYEICVWMAPLIRKGNLRLGKGT